MTDVKQKSGISCNAAPGAVFDLLERDRTEFRSDELTRYERVGETPFGPGYRTIATVVHGGELCSSETLITICDRPWLLHEEWVHRCRQSGRTITGSQRFQITEDATSTIVVCEIVQRKPGLDGFIESLFGSLCNPARLKVARLAMAAEALELARARDSSAGSPAAVLSPPP